MSLSLPSTEQIEYKSVLKDVLGNCGTLKESLAHFGCKDIYNFLSLTLSEIDSITKPNPAEELPLGLLQGPLQLHRQPLQLLSLFLSC